MFLQGLRKNIVSIGSIYIYPYKNYSKKYDKILKEIEFANKDLHESMKSCIDNGKKSFFGTGLFGQTKTGFSEWNNDNLFSIAKDIFPEEIEALKLKEKNTNYSNIEIQSIENCDIPISDFKNNQYNQCFVGGPTCLYAAATNSLINSNVLLINNNKRGIHHGSARVMHSEESQQNENPLCYNLSAILTYLKRSILPPKLESVDIDYLRVDAIAPEIFSSTKLFIDWLKVLSGMGINILYNRFNEKRGDNVQWYDDIEKTKLSTTVLKLLNEYTSKPILYEGKLAKEEPEGMGPYVYVAIGKNNIKKRLHYNDTLNKLSNIKQEELSKKELKKLFPAAINLIDNDELSGWTLEGNGVINPNYQSLLEELIKKNGTVIKANLSKIFVNNHGDVVGIQTINDNNIKNHYLVKTLTTSLGHCNVKIGSKPLSWIDNILETRNPFSSSIPATGTSVTGLSIVKSKKPPIHAITGLVNMHRNQLASKMISPGLWAILWRTTTGGNTGGSIENAKTYPTYYYSAEKIQETLWGIGKENSIYGCESAFNVKACPRQLTADEQPTLYLSGKNKSLGFWSGWQGLGVERPPSIVFQHALQNDSLKLSSYAKLLNVSEKTLKENNFHSKNITEKIIKVHQWEENIQKIKINNVHCYGNESKELK